MLCRQEVTGMPALPSHASPSQAWAMHTPADEVAVDGQHGRHVVGVVDAVAVGACSRRGGAGEREGEHVGVKAAVLLSTAQRSRGCRHGFAAGRIHSHIHQTPQSC